MQEEVEKKEKVMTKQKSNSPRFIELDLLRGFAISIMVLFHLLWDLDYFGIVRLNKAMYNSNIIFQALFLILVGVTLAVKSNRIKEPSTEMYKQIMRHGLWIFSLGMAIYQLFYALSFSDSKHTTSYLQQQ